MSGPRYSIIPGDALSDPNVKDGHLRVLAVLGTHTDKNGWCKVNQKSIAERVGKSRETVNRIIKDLCELGYVRKEDGWSQSEGRSISRYQVLMDRPEVAQDAAAPSDASVTTPVTPERHNPCDIQTSQHNDPSFNDPSLRDERARTRFAELWAVFPLRSNQSRKSAIRAFLALSESDQVEAVDGGRRKAAQVDAARIARGESAERAREFVPALVRWIEQEGWKDLTPVAAPAVPELAVIAPGTPDFEAVMLHMGDRVRPGKSGSLTVRKADLEEARRLVA